MSAILKQFVKIGMLSERVYGMEDSEGDHVTADQAKIDPGQPQNLDPDPTVSANKKDNEDGEKDEEDQDPKPTEKVEDEEDSIKIDGSRALTSLHASLHGIQVLADLVYGAKDDLIAKLGDEAGPALHEVLFKVKTAHETLEGLMNKVEKDPENVETDKEIKDQEKDEAEETPPAETAAAGAHPPQEKKPEAESY